MKKQMLLKSALLCCLFLGILISCSTKDEEEDLIDTEEIITENRTDSYYFFEDDKLECTPISQSRPLVSTVGIISYPCQSSSAALSFYFDLMKVINIGSYEVLASENINVTPGEGKVTIVFYSHDSKNWFAQSGTVTVTTNSDDSSKIDLKFKNLLMKAEDGTETNFTGQIIGV